MSPRTNTALPTVEPIVPIIGSPPLQDPKWIYEPKFDGFPGVLYLSGRDCYIRSKRGNVLRRFGQLADRVRAELSAKDAILDGEVVALDDEGRMDFRGLLAGRGWLHYAAFDALWLNGRDLRYHSLTRRKRRLAVIIPANTETVSRVFTVEGGKRAI
jgi:bifunctional non-homologous end joining protein LigD